MLPTTLTSGNSVVASHHDAVTILIHEAGSRVVLARLGRFWRRKVEI